MFQVNMMTCINVAEFVLISQLEKDHSMRCLTNVVIFIQTILSFVLSRKIINIYNDIARKYGNVIVKDFRKYEKPSNKFYNNYVINIYPRHYDLYKYH